MPPKFSHLYVQYKIPYHVREASNDKAQKYQSMTVIQKRPNRSLHRDLRLENICALVLTLSAPQAVFKTGPNTWGLTSVLRAVVKLKKRFKYMFWKVCRPNLLSSRWANRPCRLNWCFDTIVGQRKEEMRRAEGAGSHPQYKWYFLHNKNRRKIKRVLMPAMGRPED